MPSKLPLKGESKTTPVVESEKKLLLISYSSANERLQKRGVKKLSEINCPFNGD